MSEDVGRRARRGVERVRVQAIDVAGRVPPNDADAEAAVLAAILLDGRCLEEVSFLSPDDFYAEKHKRVFEAARSVAAKLEPVDIQTIASWLNDRDWLQAVGGVSFLAQLVDATPAIAHVGSHAKVLVRKAQVRRLIAAAQMVAAEGYAHTGDDDEYFDTAAATMSAALQRTSDASLEFFDAIGERRLPELQHQWADKSRGYGMFTGIAAYDEMTGGLYPGQHHALAALSGGGKSAFALQVARAVAGQVYEGEVCAVLFVSGEMSGDEVFDRALAQHAQIDAFDIQTGEMDYSAAQRWSDTLGEIGRVPIAVYQRKATVSEIKSLIRAQQSRLDKVRAPNGMRYRVRMVVVDYLQIMKLEERPSERLDTAIGRYTSGLKEVAGEFGVHVIDVSQLTREVLKDARRPQTSDLKESGSIENDSDIVSFIHRPFIAEDDKKSERAVATRDYAELIIGKLRGRGKSKGIGTTVLRFFEAQTRFAEPDDATRARWRSARGDDEPPPDGRRRRK